MNEFVRVPAADWQNILDATRGKTGGTEKMLSGEVAAAIAGIQAGGGGGSMETGEFTQPNNNFPVIPVSSKKSHILIYPKVIEDETHNMGRISYILSVDGLFHFERRRGSASYFYTDTTKMPVFSDDNITFKVNGVPFNKGDFYWFAW